MSRVKGNKQASFSNHGLFEVRKSLAYDMLGATFVDLGAEYKRFNQGVHPVALLGAPVELGFHHR